LAVETNLVVEMVHRIDHLIAVLEPAKRVDDNIVRLNSVLGVRFRHYIKYMTYTNDILREINKLANLGRKKFDKSKKFPLTPNHYINALEYIKESRSLLGEILDIVKQIYGSESKAYNVEAILNKHLVEIKNNVGDWGSTTHPLVSDLETIDKEIVACRDDINTISVEIKKVYDSIRVMYDVLRKEEGLMDSFYSKLQSRLEHFKRYYDHMPAGGFSGFEWQEKGGLLKDFEALEKDSKERFGNLDRIRSDNLFVINSIKREVVSSYRVHDDIRSKLGSIKSLLRAHYAAKQLVF